MKGEAGKKNGRIGVEGKGFKGGGWREKWGSSRKE